MRQDRDHPMANGEIVKKSADINPTRSLNNPRPITKIIGMDKTPKIAEGRRLENSDTPKSLNEAIKDKVNKGARGYR